MKKKLYHDELEGFLSESAEDLRMYPSARVWRNIDSKIHGEKQWPALTFAAILTGAITLAGLIFMQPNKDLFKPKQPSVAITKSIAKEIATANFTVNNSHFKPVASNPSDGSHSSSKIASRTWQDQDVDADANVYKSSGLNSTSNTLTGNTEKDTETNFAQITSAGVVASDDWKDARLQSSITTNSQEIVYDNTNQTESKILEGVTPASANFANIMSAKDPVAGEAANMSPLKKNPKKSKWSVQYYASPSLSYRMIAEEKQAGSFAASMGAAPANNLNSLGVMVNHKPKLGMEAGVAFMYNLTESFRVKGGLQMNYRQYAIDAYATSTPQPALIRLDQGNSFDTIFASSSVSNVGVQQDAIQVTNHFFQIGIPIGFELDMVDFNKVHFVLAATFQPTYNIGQQAWLISSDYQSYVKQPSLMRQWNFNTGVEAFLRFSNKSGNLNWQVGPQIRYQLLPGAVNKYPVREHLIDYGLKIGVSKTLN